MPGYPGLSRACAVRPGFLGPDRPPAQASHASLGQALVSPAARTRPAPDTRAEPAGRRAGADAPPGPVLQPPRQQSRRTGRPKPSITGFPFHDRDAQAGLPADLARFLDDGPPPIVFTLGSSAASIAGPFHERSAQAAKRLGRRAVLILGDPRTRPRSLPEGVAAFDYAPFSSLFPRAAAVVFPGGIGTTGLAMRSGRPMLVVPHAHDQPDTADRLARLGIARTIDRHRYTPERASAGLQRLLEYPGFPAGRRYQPGGAAGRRGPDGL